MYGHDTAVFFKGPLDLSFIFVVCQGSPGAKDHKCQGSGDDKGRGEAVVKKPVEAQSCEASIEHNEVNDINAQGILPDPEKYLLEEQQQDDEKRTSSKTTTRGPAAG